MNALSRLSEFVSKICQVIGSLSLVCIIMVTLTDVVTRYLFKITQGASGFTVKGSVELVSYLMLFALLAAFVAFVERSQIIVDVFTQKMSHKIKAFLMGVFMMVFAVVSFVFVLGLYELMHDSIEYGNVTQDLRISMTPIYGFATFLCFLLMIRSFIESLNIFRTGEFHNAEEAG